MRNRVLRAVETHRGGATANDVLTYLSREFGVTVRPNRPAPGIFEGVIDRMGRNPPFPW